MLRYLRLLGQWALGLDRSAGSRDDGVVLVASPDCRGAAT